jgi:23S rRNA (uracil1939-C5)-methyltransferase
VGNFSIPRGAVGEVLSKLREEKNFSPPDIVVVDPPRTGLDKKAIGHIVELSPKEILYISCNPKTQAEDVEQIATLGYQLKIIQPIDQFPHTVHVENLVLLQKS